MGEPVRFEAFAREEWRAWLRKNHKKESKVLLIRHKRHTGKPTFNNKEAMLEAICFGWIDTTAKRIDEDRYGQTYVRRGKNSRWSNNTLSYAKKLIADGRMAKAGLAAYEYGKGRLLPHSDIPKDPQIPEDLKQALNRDKRAKTFFDSLAPSYRRVYVVWVYRAVRPETRKRRIEALIANCRARKKWGE